MTHETIPADDAPRLSIVRTMATSFGMAEDTFMATMRATVFAKGMKREEEAAFLLVARHHNLNPVTREIYAMPKQGGGIIPVVSIDGWVRMANEHPAFDGMEFESEHAGDALVSTTCRIYRKDRKHPVAVTEYLAECKRPTDPWKMQHRMLRHKAMIQCARYAFGFAGIYDPDEAERFAAPLAGGEMEAPTRRAPSPGPAPQQLEHKPEAPAAAERQPEPARQTASEPRRAPSPAATQDEQPKPAEAAQRPSRPDQQQAGRYDPEKVRKGFIAAAAAAKDHDELNAAWDTHVDPWTDGDEMMKPDREDLDRLYGEHASRLDGRDR